MDSRESGTPLARFNVCADRRMQIEPGLTLGIGMATRKQNRNAKPHIPSPKP